jgi:uncharacterized damage-inducible protein DinB
MDTYFLFLVARGKLHQENSNSDMNLRKLLGHLALMDAIFIHLATSQKPGSYTDGAMSFTKQKLKHAIKINATLMPRIDGKDSLACENNNS